MDKFVNQLQSQENSDTVITGDVDKILVCMISFVQTFFSCYFNFYFL